MDEIIRMKKLDDELKNVQMNDYSWKSIINSTAAIKLVRSQKHVRKRCTYLTHDHDPRESNKNK